jgi:hypothetical protein
VNWKKAATWLGIAFVIATVLASPEQASTVVHGGLDGLHSAARQLHAFVWGLLA